MNRAFDSIHTIYLDRHTKDGVVYACTDCYWLFEIKCDANHMWEALAVACEDHRDKEASLAQPDGETAREIYS